MVESYPVEKDSFSWPPCQQGRWSSIAVAFLLMSGLIRSLQATHFAFGSPPIAMEKQETKGKVTGRDPVELLFDLEGV